MTTHGCEWRRVWRDSDETWETCCGKVFAFTADGPRANGFRFCPYCGGKLKIVGRKKP